MNKGLIFITIAVVIIAVLFGVMSFINFEPTTPYVSDSEKNKESIQSTTEGNIEEIPQPTQETNEEIPPLPEVPVESNQSSGITAAMLSKHNTQQDCWVGFNGKVYDLTSWLPKHPGSAGAIVPHCGTSTQFENAFKGQHGESKSALFMKVAIYKGDLI